MRGTLWAPSLADVDTRDPVEWAHPLNQGRVLWLLGLSALAGGGRWFDLCGRFPAAGALVGGPTWAASQYGDAGLLFDGAATRYAGLSGVDPSGRATFGAAATVRVDTSASASKQTLFGSGSDGTSGSWGVFRRTDGEVSGYCFDSASRMATAAAALASNGQWARIALIKSAVGGLSVAINGRVLATVSAGTGAQSTQGTSPKLGIRTDDNSNTRWKGPVFDAAVWYDCPLLHSAAQFAWLDYEQSLAGHPDTLRRVRPWSFGVAAGGGGTPEGSGAATGVGGAAGTGLSTRSGSGAVSGVGGATGTGLSVRSASGGASATGGATATGLSVRSGSGTVSGVGVATATGLSARQGSGTATGVGGATGTGSLPGAQQGSGSATGVGGATGTGLSSHTGSVPATPVSGFPRGIFAVMTAGDWRYWPEREDATLRVRTALGMYDSHPLTAADGAVKRRAVTWKEMTASAGAYTNRDRVWLIPAAHLPAGVEPRPGDQVRDAGDTDWTVGEVGVNKFGQTYRCVCRALAVVHELSATGVLLRPDAATDASGRLDPAYAAVGAAVRCRVQSLDAAVGETDQRVVLRRAFAAYLESPLDARAKDVFEVATYVSFGGAIVSVQRYTIRAARNADRIWDLMQLDLELIA